ncbi:MAG: hypothetical protein ACREFA_05735 [Stellaceae bacterium]
MLAAGAGARAATSLAATPALVRDFMIQNVCLDAAGTVIEGVSPIDPGGRCTRQRDLLPGERLPYHKDDHPATRDRAALPLGYQRHDSFPVRTADFGTVVEDSFDFGVGEGRRFGVFDTGKGDGGDIVLFAPGVVSIGATEDAGAGFQLFVGAGCHDPIGPAALARSWIIALYRPGGLLQGETVARLNDLREGHQQACPSRLNFAYTHWQVKPVRYDAGVTLLTLISEHYGGKAPDQASQVERFYFTRELGATRWESWWNPERAHRFSPAEIDAAAARLAASGRCGPVPPPKGGPFVMVDCREWTVIVPPINPKGDPPGFFVKAIRHRPLGGGLFAAPSVGKEAK